MQRKRILLVLMLVLSIFVLSITAAFAQGEPQGPPPSAFTGTVFALSFAFILGLGGIVLYGTSKDNHEEPKAKTKTVKNPRSSKNKNVSVNNKPVNKPAKGANNDKKDLRRQLLAGEIDEETYLEEVNKLK